VGGTRLCCGHSSPSWRTSAKNEGLLPKQRLDHRRAKKVNAKPARTGVLSFLTSELCCAGFATCFDASIHQACADCGLSIGRSKITSPPPQMADRDGLITHLAQVYPRNWRSASWAAARRRRLDFSRSAAGLGTQRPFGLSIGLRDDTVAWSWDFSGLLRSSWPRSAWASSRRTFPIPVRPRCLQRACSRAADHSAFCVIRSADEDVSPS